MSELLCMICGKDAEDMFCDSCDARVEAIRQDIKGCNCWVHQQQRRQADD